MSLPKFSISTEHNYGVNKCDFCKKKLVPSLLDKCIPCIVPVTIGKLNAIAQRCKTKSHWVFRVQNVSSFMIAFVCSEECGTAYILSKL